MTPQPHIRRLDRDLVNRIAAGEVIERPASVVKELAENAIDAGATRIEVVIAAGGVSLIRVTDDGRGIPRDELPLAIERHCTSKLGGGLDRIATLGFRGEALAAIGAAARLAITSHAEGASEAWALTVTAGKIAEPAPAALNRGTRVEVRDLFFATPARLKFLKSERAEATAVVDVVRRLALAHPEVHVTLAGAGRSTFDYPARTGESALAERIGQVLGRDFTGNAFRLDAEREGVRLTGLAGLPTHHRANGLGQFFFVNGRPLKDRQLLGALRGAYADVMKPGRFPVAALYIAIDPADVDVNVHPAKADVRFRDPGLVRGLIVGSIRDAIAGGSPRSSTGATSATVDAFRRPGATSFGSRPARPMTPARPHYAQGATGLAEAAAAAYAFAPPSGEVAESAPVPDPAEQPLGAARAQLHDAYIVAQTATGLVIVDQHAAHERIVYEKLKAARAANGRPPSQILLVPDVVELPADAVAMLAERAGELAELGLVLEPFGPQAIAVSETPALLGHVDSAGLVRDLADEIAEWDGTAALAEQLDRVASTMACHGSIRAGRRMKPDEMNALLRQMESTPNASQCNHGRPTYIELGLNDIERLFGRR